MNELALIFDRMGIRTKDVLEAARTKWNFLPSPGLVGGHCIGVDPYYLTHKAEELGYQSQVILSGRRINDDMGAYIGQRVTKMLALRGRLSPESRVGILGLTFKENVSDLRNSRVPDIVEELREFGVEPILHDPMVDREEALHELRVRVSDLKELKELDALIFAVPYRELLEIPVDRLCGMVREGGVLVDVKSVLDPKKLRAGIGYWSL